MGWMQGAGRDHLNLEELNQLGSGGQEINDSSGSSSMREILSAKSVTDRHIASNYNNSR